MFRKTRIYYNLKNATNVRKLWFLLVYSLIYAHNPFNNLQTNLFNVVPKKNMASDPIFELKSVWFATNRKMRQSSINVCPKCSGEFQNVPETLLLAFRVFATLHFGSCAFLSNFFFLLRATLLYNTTPLVWHYTTLYYISLHWGLGQGTVDSNPHSPKQVSYQELDRTNCV